MASTTISEAQKELYVWIWLPGADTPVVAGRVWSEGPNLNFNYGARYLERHDAIPLYLPELPLRSGPIPPADGLTMPGCLADAMPDAWGRRVIQQHLLATRTNAAPADELDPLTYLAHSGSERFGALDFQRSATDYLPRDPGGAPLAELMRAATMLDEGKLLRPDLDRALLHGSSIGGARPKALLEDDGRRYIAKFSAASDREFPFVKAEFVAMRLARRVGLEVADVAHRQVLGRDVLLVERFDRLPGTARRLATVSALTLFGLPEESRPEDWSYGALADIIRARFTDPGATLRELFGRIVFNILVSNTDDHPRNHAAFWDGSSLTLTPAYDISPMRRAGEVEQLMAISPDGSRRSRLSICTAAAPTYHLSKSEAEEIIDHQVSVIEADWAEVCDCAEMTEVERASLWRRQFLNRYAFESD
jgi:serine/threonine-protein kinase HipA